MLFIYPALFKKEEGSYWVSFPDLEGCFSQGDTPKEAMEHASEALELYLSPDDTDKTPLTFPKSTDIEVLKKPKEGFISYVSAKVDLTGFDKSVKKNCTIPKWLSDTAEDKGISFSKTLQEALLQRIGQ